MGPRLSDYRPFIPHGWPIFSYGFCIMMGFLTALFIATRRARNVGISSDDVVDLAFWAFLSGIIGARVFHVIEFRAHYFGPGRSIWQVFAFHKGGLVFYGGFMTASLVIALVVRRKKLPLLPTLDMAAATMMIGSAWGRLGCFSRGCCYGVPTQAWWGVVFPPNAPAYDGTGLAPGSPVVPTQLISSFDALAIFLITSVYFLRWRRRDGEVVVLLLTLYPIHRFLIEFWRADTAVPNGLSIAQKISILVFLVAAGLFVWLRTRPKPQTPPGSADAVATPARPQGATDKPQRKRGRKAKDRHGSDA